MSSNMMARYGADSPLGSCMKAVPFHRARFPFVYVDETMQVNAFHGLPTPPYYYKIVRANENSRAALKKFAGLGPPTPLLK